MVALFEGMLTDHVKDTGITFQAGWVQRHPMKNVSYALEATFRVFQSHATHKPVNFVAE
jgi:hypothetical protein